MRGVLKKNFNQNRLTILNKKWIKEWNFMSLLEKGKQTFKRDVVK